MFNPRPLILLAVYLILYCTLTKSPVGTCTGLLLRKKLWPISFNSRPLFRFQKNSGPRCKNTNAPSLLLSYSSRLAYSVPHQVLPKLARGIYSVTPVDIRARNEKQVSDGHAPALHLDVGCVAGISLQKGMSPGSSINACNACKKCLSPASRSFPTPSVVYASAHRKKLCQCSGLCQRVKSTQDRQAIRIIILQCLRQRKFRTQHRWPGTWRNKTFSSACCKATCVIWAYPNYDAARILVQLGCSGRICKRRQDE